MKARQTILILLVLFVLSSCVYQRADMSTDMSVASPRYVNGRAQAHFDAGHQNFHGLKTSYAPFATLLRNDGIELIEHSGNFSKTSLGEIDMLIIVNALPPEGERSAFSVSEINSLEEWVREGGSLLLIADHDPFGSASADLAGAFGVEMASVWTADTLRRNDAIGRNTWLEFSPSNGGLGDHPITRSGPVPMQQVITFTGQSLAHDSTWTPILRLSTVARDYYEREQAKIFSSDPGTFMEASGRSQLIAKAYGKGRVVISGEAAMFTAQEVRIFFNTMRAGFNYPGYENKQLLLNTIHWLLEE